MHQNCWLATASAISLANLKTNQENGEDKLLFHEKKYN